MNTLFYNTVTITNENSDYVMLDNWRQDCIRQKRLSEKYSVEWNHHNSVLNRIDNLFQSWIDELEQEEW